MEGLYVSCLYANTQNEDDAMYRGITWQLTMGRRLTQNDDVSIFAKQLFYYFFEYIYFI